MRITLCRAEALASFTREDIRETLMQYHSTIVREGLPIPAMAVPSEQVADGIRIPDYLTSYYGWAYVQ